VPKWAAELKDAILTAIQSLGAKPEDKGDEAPEGTDDDAELEKLLAELEGGQGDQGKPAGPPAPEAKDAEVKLSRVERENAKLKADLAERDLRDKLVALQRDGYSIDVEQEVKLLMPVDPQTRSIFLSRIQTNYPKAPVGGKPLDGLDEASTASKRPFDAKAQAEVKAKALKLGRWEDAFTEVMGYSCNELGK
jgi:hypothetical protein